MRPERERLTSQDGFSTAFCWASPAAWVQSDGEISKRAPAAPRAGHSVSSQLTFHCCFMLCRSIGYVLSLIQIVWRAAGPAMPCHMPLLRSCGLSVPCSTLAAIHSASATRRAAQHPGSRLVPFESSHRRVSAAPAPDWTCCTIQELQ